MKIKRFKELLEDVGDKYAELKFNIPPKFSEFDKQYRRRYNNIGQEIIFKDGRRVILKNPKTLENIGPWVRGIIDNKGNLYIEQEAMNIHDPLITIVSNLGLVNHNVTTWHIENPNNPFVGFITVQRKDDGNIFLGESNIWYTDNEEISYSIFQEYLNKARLRNPGIHFTNKRINR